MSVKSIAEELGKCLSGNDLSHSDITNVLLGLYATKHDLTIYEKLAIKFAADDVDKMLNGDLSEVMLRLHVLYIYKPQLLTGDLLAILAKKLIKLEISEGGPYNTKDKLYTNALIAQFFRLISAPLPKVESYLLENIDDFFIKGDLILIVSVSWPHKFHQKDLLQYKNRKDMSFAEKSAWLCMHQENTQKPAATRLNTSNTSITLARDEIDKIPLSVKPMASKYLSKIIEIDRMSEISSLSKYFLTSLKNNPTIPQRRLATALGAANIYAWIAYTIYDDFIDDEGDPAQLPLANIMHRKSYKMYATHFSTEADIIEHAYNTVDESNLWEVKNCRFDIREGWVAVSSIPYFESIEYLAKKSIGHILGPELIARTNKHISDEQQAIIHDALSSYLIARQLNDDIKDWKTDLGNGHISYVVASLLNDANLPEGSYRTKELIATLQNTFWTITLERLLVLASQQIQNTKELLKLTRLFKENNMLYEYILDPLEKSTVHDLALHQNEKKFMFTYSRNL